ARSLLVRRHDQRNLSTAPLPLLFVIEEHRVVGRQNGPAAIAENGLDPLVGQHLHDHPRPGHGLAGKRMPGGARLGDGVAHAELSESAGDRAGGGSWETSRSVCGTKDASQRAASTWPARSFILVPSPAHRGLLRPICVISSPFCCRTRPAP